MLSQFNKGAFSRELMRASITSFGDAAIVITGGFRLPDKACRTVIHYKITLNRWSFLPDMITARNTHSSCSTGNDLYVFGGKDHRNKPLSSMEKLDYLT